MKLDPFPRISLAHLPTPLEPMIALSKFLGGPKIYIKRDDCTGLATGGNKARKLEFLMAEARRSAADIVITQGAVQSNHVRQTLAAAARLDIRCKVLLSNPMPDAEAAYHASGNFLLDQMLGADIEYRGPDCDMNHALEQLADSLKVSGITPYLIPGGGSNPTGALGYVCCARELIEQFASSEIQVNKIILATGSAGTQAGLLAGMVALQSDIDIIGICVGDRESAQYRKIESLLESTAALIGVGQKNFRHRIKVNDNYIGDGYGIPTSGMREALELCARLEGVILDPVYSGKAMAGLIDMVRSGHLTEEDTVVFLHTGGATALFAYDWYFSTDSGRSD